MANEDFKQMMDELVVQEEKGLGVGSPEFMERHDKIMAACDKVLLKDLMLERLEGM